MTSPDQSVPSTAPIALPSAEVGAQIPFSGEDEQEFSVIHFLKQMVTNPAFALFLLGLIVSVFFYHTSNEGQRYTAQKELEALGAERSEVLNLRLLRAVDGLRAVAALFTLGENVSRSQFQGYGNNTLLWLPEINQLQWQPLISADERALYEAMAHQDGLANFELVEPGPDGKLMRARDRKQHLPVFYQIARPGKGDPLGLDLATNPVQMENKWLAADTGQITTYIPLRSTTNKGVKGVASDGNVILSLPVYRQPNLTGIAERHQQLRGFVAADLRLDELVQSVIAGLPERGIDVFLYLHTHRHDELIYHRLAKNSDFAVAQNRDLDFVRTLDIAGRQWLLLLHPTQVYLADQKTKQPELVLVVGLLLSGAFAGHMFNTQRQRRWMERVNTELVESQGRFNLFMDRHPGITFIKDADGRLIFINQTLADILGFSSEGEWYGRNDIFYWPEEAVEACSRHDRFVMEINQPVVVEEPVSRNGHDEVWLAIKFPFVDHQGKQFLGGIATDITARKKAEAQSLLSAHVFENAAEAIVITNSENHIITVNPAFEQITGYRGDEVIGRDPKILKSGRQPLLFYQRLWQTLMETGCWQGEMWNRRKNGELYAEWLSISVVCDDAGRVTHYIGIFSDITERKEAEERIQFLAHYDDLTQLPNRTLTRDRLQQALLAADRNQTCVAVLFLDLDRFKVINDSLGHHVGDLLLQQVAKRLSECLREVDTVGRLGGDEFLLVLPETDVDGAAHVAQKILDRMAKTFEIDEHKLSNSPSIGIAVYPANGDSLLTLMKNADVAMYHAKQAGRGNYQFFSSEMNAVAHEQLRLENDLRLALERGQLSMFYQPKVDLTNQQIIGCEALMRWQHPDLGMISPIRFISLAEESGLIVALGEWAMRTACQHMLVFQRVNGQAMTMAVNVSALQFSQSSFVNTVHRVLKETGLAAQYLELELTESALMKDAANVIETLKALSAMGVKLSIDDFGTGYSSLSYLKRFPIDCLKVDQSFVRDLETDGDDAAIVSAIISLAHTLRLTVVAEGVETIGQVQYLQERGCESAQGFYFSKPLSAEDFENVAAKRTAAAA